MAKKKDSDSPTLEIVRAVAEKLARDTNRSVSELTVPELIVATNGSAGYIGAHLQTIKVEHARAARFDTGRLPIQLVSGLCEALEHIQKRGEEIGRAEGKITQETFDYICQSNTTLEAKVYELERQLANDALERRAEKLDFDTKQQRAQVEIQSLNNSYTNVQRSLTDATQQLGDAKFELGANTARLKELEDLLSSKDQSINDLGKRLSDAEKKYESADTQAKEHKQRAELLSMRNGDLNTDISKLKVELEAANRRAADAEAELRVRGAKVPASAKKNPSAPGNK